MKDLITIAVIIMSFIGILFLTSGRVEKAECYNWQRQAEEYEHFYLTEPQAEQCDHHNIKINAPIK